MYASLISYRAFMNPEGVAMITDEGKISFQKLNAWVEHAAAALKPMLPQTRTVVSVNLTQLPLHWILLLALARLGHVSVSQGTDDSPELAGATFVLTGHPDHAGPENTLLLTPDAAHRVVLSFQLQPLRL